MKPLRPCPECGGKMNPYLRGADNCMHWVCPNSGCLEQTNFPAGLDMEDPCPTCYPEEYEEDEPDPNGFFVER